MNEAVFITSPVGRLVQGKVFEGSNKDAQGRPRLTQLGQPKMQWFIGVAFPKGPEWDAMWAQITQTAQRDFPGQEWNQPGFAWKVVDGDAPANANKAGFPGHYILRMATGFAPTAYNSNDQQIVDHQQIVCGYYIQVYFSIRGNGEPATGKPGMYINHSMVRLVGYGDVIASGPSAEQAFGAVPLLPQGASITPLAPAAAMPAPVGAPPMAAPAAPAVAAPMGVPTGSVVPVAPALAPVQALALNTPPPVMEVPGTAVPLPTAYPSNTPPAGVPAGVQPAPGFAVLPASVR